MTIRATLSNGALTLEDDCIVLEWGGRFDPRKEHDPQRISLDDIRTVEFRPDTKWRRGWVRFGGDHLGKVSALAGEPPAADLDWILVGAHETENTFLVEIVQTVAERIGQPDPFAPTSSPARPASKPPTGDGNARTTFYIHALGPSGSGKTVFMASLYNRLRLRRPELAFHLKTDHDNSLHLNTVFNQVANPDEMWPTATQGVHEWRFRARLSSPAGDFEPIEFVYLDYPGGVLTNPRAAGDPAIQELVTRLRSANALLILLDGQAMLSLMRGERHGHRYLEFDLTSSLEIAQQSRCPVHFVITKWDLLHEAYTLDAVRDRLMADENFSDLIAAKVEDIPAPIRLIPASAVGFGFAKALPSGEMEKTGRSLRPHNVELPLVSVLPDFFQFAYHEMQSREDTLAPDYLSRASAWLSDNQRAAKLQAFAEAAMPKLKRAIVMSNPKLAPLLNVDTEGIAAKAVGFALRLAQSRAERSAAGRAAYAESVNAQRASVNSESAALQLLTLQFEQILSDYEIAQPASVLGCSLEQFNPEPEPA
ncbi:hypothetical protein [Rhodococcus sp. T7]|uniref:hypothetical protein n=1 Tax=Rhodococcus sp. T7 TaxID=627444 RepID=UPI00135A223B|nr:hypothetical protein [Rhodococcus sp. T7]KAF0957314.1 hypothetical protein MLGJGCBP_09144 [Rhodococcus sp. T7]KAF0959193.1 hypothetical protein MLGJGCBP_07706 [Rhodococcus sp. T7]